ncbi:hypothetical protein EC840_108186 [Rahnella sp. JUb53]|uniref:DUF6708 domain-containing protein n=1 Tax=Rahnella sp. JUb53 TaxID=2485128 RepID=UPI001053C510|nr:hypothetical protein EC840_108186 [Rahnella sp. JUb53]
MKRQSRLDAPVRYWDEDLPKQADDQKAPPQLIRVNEINDVWMEIPRYVNYGWGGMWFSTLVMFSVLIISAQFFLAPSFPSNSLFLFMIGLHIFVLSSFFIYCIRRVLFEPRGAPVRFNRKRQKVYVYEYQRSVWPWKRWPVVIKVFDWADIQGERVQLAGHADWGHRIYCAVCKPGTHEVVDRFVLAWTVGNLRDAYGLWSHCCHYMEARPVPKNPLLTDKPADWTPFRTVRWPPDVERESTTDRP